MTNAEAIRYLKSLKEEQIEFLRDLDSGCGIAVARKKYICAIKQAIAALEARGSQEVREDEATDSEK